MRNLLSGASVKTVALGMALEICVGGENDGNSISELTRASTRPDSNLNFLSKEERGKIERNGTHLPTCTLHQPLHEIIVRLHRSRHPERFPSEQSSLGLVDDGSFEDFGEGHVEFLFVLGVGEKVGFRVCVSKSDELTSEEEEM